MTTTVDVTPKPVTPTFWAADCGCPGCPFGIKWGGIDLLPAAQAHHLEAPGHPLDVWKYIPVENHIEGHVEEHVAHFGPDRGF
jgi:hypothetical protein